MKKLTFSGFLVAMMLAACGSARAVEADPSSDIHCAVLSFHFSEIASTDPSATQKQRQSLALTQQWYATKVRAIAIERGDAEGVLGESRPLLEAVNRDPIGMKPALVECAKRATKDPEFQALLAK